MSPPFKLSTPPRRSRGAVSSGLIGLKGSARDMAKYLAEVTSGVEDYIVGDAIVATRWIGGGIRALGLEGRVSEGELEGVLIGRPIGQLDDEDAELVVNKSRTLNGWDISLGPPKSYSVLVAAASPEMRSLLIRSQTQAVECAVASLDQSIGTRRGAQGRGGWEQAPGIIAAATTHLTSRANDPQLHTHLTIANRVQTADGKTLSIDSKVFHDASPHAVTMYGRELRRITSEILGIKWTGPDPKGHYEVAGVPESLIAEFSKRDHEIKAYREAHPEVTEDYAAKVTRQAKGKPEPIEAKFARWQARIIEIAPRWARRMLRAGPPAGIAPAAEHVALPQPDAPEPTPELRRQVVEQAARDLTTRIAQWDQLEARQTIAELAPMSWTDNQVASVADELMQSDLVCGLGAPAMGGVDSIRPGGQRFSTWEVLEAEARLIHFFSADQPPRADLEQSQHAAEAAIAQAEARDGHPLDPSQADTVRAIAATSRGHVVVGPAGAGKTTVFSTIADWGEQMGIDRSRMVGMAVAQKASDLIGNAMGCDGFNTTKALLQDRVPHNGLVVVDEGSMVNTTQLDRITRLAAERSTKVVLVGDPAQLGAVKGPAGMLQCFNTAPVAALSVLHTPWRFSAEWERQASLALHDRDSAVRDTYLREQRIIGITPDVGPMEIEARHKVATERIAARVVDDLHNGDDALVVTSTNVEAEAINTEIQTTLFPNRRTEPVLVAGKAMQIGVGDKIVTRQNDFTVATTMGAPVLNGGGWIVEAISGGDLKCRSTDTGVGSVILKADYLNPPDQDPDDRPPIQLGWAVTAHTGQGQTVDIAYALVNDRTSSEALYVMGTRGRHANYFVTAGDQNEAVDAFDSALQRSRASMSATYVDRQLRQDATQPVQNEPSPGPPTAPPQLDPSLKTLLQRARNELHHLKDNDREKALTAVTLPDGRFMHGDYWHELVRRNMMNQQPGPLTGDRPTLDELNNFLAAAQKTFPQYNDHSSDAFRDSKFDMNDRPSWGRFWEAMTNRHLPPGLKPPAPSQPSASSEPPPLEPQDLDIEPQDYEIGL